MNTVVMLAAVAALGIEVGWQPLPEGGHEYTLQIEPQLLRVLEGGGEELISEVPPEIHIRRYRVTVGTGKLARNAGEPTPAGEAPRQPAVAQSDPQQPPAGQAEPATDDVPPAAGAPEFPTKPGADDVAHTPAGDDAREPGAGKSTFSPDAQVPAEGPPPGKLPPDSGASGPIRPATFDDAPPKGETKSRGQETLEKPMLPGAEPNRPWGVLLGSVALLCVSLGGNIYLGLDLLGSAQPVSRRDCQIRR
jgi:hypothetical protein